MRDNYTYISSEAKKELKISDCKLMHLREEGVIKAIKKGRAFLYNEDDIKSYNELKNKN